MTPKGKRSSQACIPCRNRKVRCDIALLDRCLNCVKANLQCVRVADQRKERPRSLAELQHKLSLYEQTIAKLKSSVDLSKQVLDSLPDSFQGNVAQESGKVEEQQVRLDIGKHGATGTGSSVNGRERVNATGRDRASRQAAPKYLQPTNFENDEKYSVTVYGPTSVFDTESVARTVSDAGTVAELSRDPHISECVKLFFRWQYPDMHSFVFREAFLLDFHHPKPGSVYCSKELVLAVCAIGAHMLNDPLLHDLAPDYYQQAKESLLSKLDSPSVSSLQAFLLLGLYDVYNGRNNAGWMLTGDGFRMGFGIGFQMEPEKWLLNRDEDVSDITFSVRSRIFWGSFFADRFLGLIMGRPWVVKVDETTIPVSINMPAIERIDEYTYPGTPTYSRASYIDVSNPLTGIISLCGIADDMLKEIFLSRSQVDLSLKLTLLARYNERIETWRENLPLLLGWDRSLLAAAGHDHTKMFMRYFYYMVLLCLNRPFVDVPKNGTTDSLAICTRAMDDLHAAILSFVQCHGFRRCSILIVYSCIISLSIILLKSNGNLQSHDRFELLFFEFMAVLKMSPWKLGERSFNKVRGTLLSEYNVDYEKEFGLYVDRLRASGDTFLAPPNTLVALMREDESVSGDYPSVSALDSEFASAIDFGGFGGPPVFMTSELTDWALLFPEYLGQ